MKPKNLLLTLFFCLVYLAISPATAILKPTDPSLLKLNNDEVSLSIKQASGQSDSPNFLFNPKKLNDDVLSLSINGGLPLPNVGFRATFPLGQFDGHLFYYYYLGGIQFIRPELDILYTERYKLTADVVISDFPFLNTNISAQQNLNLVSAGLLAQISSFTAFNCFSGLIGYYKANTDIPNTNVNNLVYIGIIKEDKAPSLNTGFYHKLGVYLPITTGQKIIYPSYTFGYIFY